MSGQLLPSKGRGLRPALLAASLLAGGLLGSLAGCQPAADSNPRTVATSTSATTGPQISVCGQLQSYPQTPQRAVVHGINIIELFLALDLQDKLAGYGGLRDIRRLPPERQTQLAGVPDLSNQGMNLETILGAQADFVFSGWSYGFREGQVTPSSLAELGISSYVLTESCIRKIRRERVSLEDTFADLLNLGKIFRVQERAEALVAAQKAQLQAVEQAVAGAPRPKVFLFDGGDAIPVTSGRYAMPHAMIEAAGGSNIFADIDSSWTNGNWEDVIARQPDWIVVVDNNYPSPNGRVQLLLAKPELADIPAIRQRRFIFIDFAEATPGPRNVQATERIARALHPKRFASQTKQP